MRFLSGFRDRRLSRTGLSGAVGVGGCSMSDMMGHERSRTRTDEDRLRNGGKAEVQKDQRRGGRRKVGGRSKECRTDVRPP